MPTNSEELTRAYVGRYQTILNDLRRTLGRDPTREEFVSMARCTDKLKGRIPYV